MCTCDLVQLVLVVKGHLVHAHLGSAPDERRRLAWVGEQDPVGLYSAQSQYLGDLAVGCAVKARAQRSQQPQHVRVWVALDGCHTTPVSNRATPTEQTTDRKKVQYRAYTEASADVDGRLDRDQRQRTLSQH